MCIVIIHTLPLPTCNLLAHILHAAPEQDLHLGASLELLRIVVSYLLQTAAFIGQDLSQTSIRLLVPVGGQHTR